MHKIHKSIIEPIILIGCSFQWVALMVFVFVTLVVVRLPVWVALLALVVMFIFGLVQTRKDPAWFNVATKNLQNFGSKVFRKNTDYVA